MSKIIEKYTGTKTYMFPNGELATPEIMQSKFPAVAAFVHIIETDEAGEVCFAVQNLAAMRSLHGIDSTFTESEAIAAIQEIANTVPEVIADPAERQATALEAIASGATAETTAVIDTLLVGD